MTSRPPLRNALESSPGLAPARPLPRMRHRRAALHGTRLGPDLGQTSGRPELRCWGQVSGSGSFHTEPFQNRWCHPGFPENRRGPPTVRAFAPGPWRVSANGRPGGSGFRWTVHQKGRPRDLPEPPIPRHSMYAIYAYIDPQNQI